MRTLVKAAGTRRSVRGAFLFLIMIAIMALAAAVPVFAAAAVPTSGAAGSLELTNSSPANGSTRMPVENVGIKLYFSGNVTSPDVWANNQTCFSLTDDKGKEVPISAYQGEKENNYILVIAEPVPAKEG
ncbi:MAG: hypothetical protein LBS85_06295, partial [Clostridiales Family XIII bacterium]|nr:hypothetical protein [Clostridiales Family XIII bacterium]